MPLAPPFTKFSTIGPVLASYDWTDIADGTGIIHFKGFKDETGYNLGTSSVYSNNIETEAAEYTIADETQWEDVTGFDYDFDLSPFNTPRTIKGIGIVNFTGYIDRTNGAGNIDFRITAKVRKGDDTEIANGVSTTILRVGAAIAQIFNISITIPKTPFEKGDTLRITFLAEVKGATNGNKCIVAIGHDPQNRDGVRIVPTTDDPTTMTKLDFYCPFEILEK